MEKRKDSAQVFPFSADALQEWPALLCPSWKEPLAPAAAGLRSWWLNPHLILWKNCNTNRSPHLTGCLLFTWGHRWEEMMRPWKLEQGHKGRFWGHWTLNSVETSLLVEAATQHPSEVTNPYLPEETERVSLRHCLERHSSSPQDPPPPPHFASKPIVDSCPRRPKKVICKLWLVRRWATL